MPIDRPAAIDAQGDPAIPPAGIARPAAARPAAVGEGGIRLYLAVVLAVVGILGALVAWRAAAAGSLAADATRDALLAQGRVGAVEVSASISAFEGFAAWQDYEIARYRGAALFNAGVPDESLRAFAEAAGHWAGVPNAFIDIEGDYEPDAYQSAIVAAGLGGVPPPAGLVARAVAAEARSADLGRAGLVLAASLPFLTAAEVLLRRRARLVLAGAGTLVALAGAVLVGLAWA
jgi:hypothetical protein